MELDDEVFFNSIFKEQRGFVESDKAAKLYSLIFAYINESLPTINNDDVGFKEFVKFFKEYGLENGRMFDSLQNKMNRALYFELKRIIREKTLDDYSAKVLKCIYILCQHDVSCKENISFVNLTNIYALYIYHVLYLDEKNKQAQASLDEMKKQEKAAQASLALNRFAEAEGTNSTHYIRPRPQSAVYEQYRTKSSNTRSSDNKGPRPSSASALRGGGLVLDFLKPSTYKNIYTYLISKAKVPIQQNILETFKETIPLQISVEEVKSKIPSLTNIEPPQDQKTTQGAKYPKSKIPQTPIPPPPPLPDIEIKFISNKHGTCMAVSYMTCVIASFQIMLRRGYKIPNMNVFNESCITRFLYYFLFNPNKYDRYEMLNVVLSIIDYKNPGETACNIKQQPVGPISCSFFEVFNKIIAQLVASEIPPLHIHYLDNEHLTLEKTINGQIYDLCAFPISNYNDVLFGHIFAIFRPVYNQKQWCSYESYTLSNIDDMIKSDVDDCDDILNPFFTNVTDLRFNVKKSNHCSNKIIGFYVLRGQDKTSQGKSILYQSSPVNDPKTISNSPDLPYECVYTLDKITDLLCDEMDDNDSLKIQIGNDAFLLKMNSDDFEITTVKNDTLERINYTNIQDKFAELLKNNCIIVINESNYMITPQKDIRIEAIRPYNFCNKATSSQTVYTIHSYNSNQVKENEVVFKLEMKDHVLTIYDKETSEKINTIPLRNIEKLSKYLEAYFGPHHIIYDMTEKVAFVFEEFHYTFNEACHKYATKSMIQDLVKPQTISQEMYKLDENMSLVNLTDTSSLKHGDIIYVFTLNALDEWNFNLTYVYIVYDDVSKGDESTKAVVVINGFTPSSRGIYEMILKDNDLLHTQYSKYCIFKMYKNLDLGFFGLFSLIFKLKTGQRPSLDKFSKKILKYLHGLTSEEIYIFGHSYGGLVTSLLYENFPIGKEVSSGQIDLQKVKKIKFRTYGSIYCAEAKQTQMQNLKKTIEHTIYKGDVVEKYGLVPSTFPYTQPTKSDNKSAWDIHNAYELEADIKKELAIPPLNSNGGSKSYMIKKDKYENKYIILKKKRKYLRDIRGKYRYLNKSQIVSLGKHVI
jgi:hypothetical protein